MLVNSAKIAKSTVGASIVRFFCARSAITSNTFQWKVSLVKQVKNQAYLIRESEFVKNAKNWNAQHGAKTVNNFYAILATIAFTRKVPDRSIKDQLQALLQIL